MEDQLLTVPEAAKILRLSKSQLYLLLQQKRIPHIRLTCRRVVLRERDIQEYLDKQEVKVSD